MTELKISRRNTSLVDQVEEKLINYFKQQGFKPGSAIPPEMELSEKLGVARTVLREALSRFKMNGMIESHTRRGMIMTEPALMNGMYRMVHPMWLTEDTLFDLLQLRITIEIGITDSIFDNIRPEDIRELENIVHSGSAISGNVYATGSEFEFHTKLYSISGNKTISEFQKIIHQAMEFAKEKYEDYFAAIGTELQKQGESVSHKMLLDIIKSGDREEYLLAIRRHFKIYTEYLKTRR